MAVKLRLVSIDGDAILVAAEGDMRRGEAPPNDVNPFETVVGGNWSGKRIILDCTKATYMDSAAIGWLMGSSRRLKENGGRLVLHSIAPRIRPMLDLLKVGRMIPIAPNEAAARELLAAGNAADPDDSGGTGGKGKGNSSTSGNTGSGGKP